MVILETNRLKLREYHLSDLDNLYEIFADTETMQYYSSPKTKEETENWINWNLKNYVMYEFGLWAIILKREKKFIGDCGMTMQDINGERKPEIGYHIHKDYWNRGFATEAASACRDYGFQHFELNEIYVKTNAKNKASIKVATNIGMKFKKEYSSKSRPGEKTDAYSLIKADWLRTEI